MPRKQTHQPDTVRIIGGQWRSRKLQFTDTPGLRPTTDRVRETVFNWLQPEIVGAHCIDLFAGSGALGFEALSRGANDCLFIENNRQCIEDINHNLKTLNAQSGETLLGDALQLLNQPPEQDKKNKFNIVFVDPPYAMDCALQCCRMLADNQWLAGEAYIYIESAAAITEDELPENWRLHRQKKAGNVNYHLAIQQL